MSEYLNDLREQRIDQQNAETAEWAVKAYEERTAGIGQGVRRDREAQARTDALRIARGLPNSNGFTTADLLNVADVFADYILNGNPRGRA